MACPSHAVLRHSFCASWICLPISLPFFLLLQSGFLYAYWFPTMASSFRLRVFYLPRPPTMTSFHSGFLFAQGPRPG